MTSFHWKAKTFQQLSIDQLFEIVKLRIEVFVVEQQCAYPELDEYDRHPDTRHLLGQNDSRQLIAYARLLPPGLRYPEVNLGRLVVKNEFRKQRVGRRLLQTTLEETSRCWPETPIRISAQDYLQKFYEQYGFARISDVYLEDGIPHVAMVKESW